MAVELDAHREVVEVVEVEDAWESEGDGGGRKSNERGDEGADEDGEGGAVRVITGRIAYSLLLLVSEGDDALWF